jgi:hypothetical protein
VYVAPNSISSAIDITDTWYNKLSEGQANPIHLARVNQLLAGVQLDDTSKTRIGNLYRHYNVAASSVSIETWFLNRWIALEALVVTGHHKSIIEHVKNLIPSILCSRYVYRLLKNFLCDCERCGASPTYRGTAINVNDPTMADVDKILKVFRDQTEFQNLLIACGVNSLLKLRCNSLEKVFKDNMALHSLISAHYTILGWHLQRIYRVRNNMVHAGRVESDLIHLTSHLDYYIASTISEIIYRLSNHDFNTLGELFSCLEENCQTTLEILGDRTSPLYDNDLVLKGPFFM